MSKVSWNRLVKETIDANVKYLWTERISSDISLQPFLQIHDKYEPCAFWALCKNYYKKFCQASVKMLSLLFYKVDISYCKACGQCFSCSPSEHLVLFCKNNESIRKELWAKLIERFGSNFYLCFISLSPFNQAVSLLSTFEHILTYENDKRSLMRIVIFTLYKMLYTCK